MNSTLAQLAACQGGVFTAAQARSCGYTTATMRRNLRRRAWLSLQRGIFALNSSGLPSDLNQLHALKVAAAVHASDGRRWAAGRSAACMLGLDCLSSVPKRPVLSEPRLNDSETGGPKRGTRSARSSHLVSLTPADQVITVGSVACTTPARTAVDLARATGGRAAVVALDSAARQFGVSLAQLREVAALQEGWPYAKRVSTALDLMDERTESVLETLGRLALPPDWPKPLSQAWVGEHHPEFRVDFLVPELWVVGEGDGKLKYGREDSLWDEKRRQDRVEDLGWTFVRFSWLDAHEDADALTRKFVAAGQRARPGRGVLFADPQWWLDQRAAAQRRAGEYRSWWLEPDLASAA